MALVIGIDKLPVSIFPHEPTMLDRSEKSGEGCTTIIVIVNIAGELKQGAVRRCTMSGGGLGC